MIPIYPIVHIQLSLVQLSILWYVFYDFIKNEMRRVFIIVLLFFIFIYQIIKQLHNSLHNFIVSLKYNRRGVNVNTPSFLSLVGTSC